MNTKLYICKKIDEKYYTLLVTDSLCESLDKLTPKALKEDNSTKQLFDKLLEQLNTLPDNTYNSLPDLLECAYKEHIEGVYIKDKDSWLCYGTFNQPRYFTESFFPTQDKVEVYVEDKQTIKECELKQYNGSNITVILDGKECKAVYVPQMGKYYVVPSVPESVKDGKQLVANTFKPIEDLEAKIN